MLSFPLFFFFFPFSLFPSLFLFLGSCLPISLPLLTLFSLSRLSPLSLPNLPLYLAEHKQNTHKFGAKSKGKDKCNNPSSSLSFLLCFPLLNLSHFGFLGEIRRMEKRQRNRDDQARVLMPSKVCMCVVMCVLLLGCC